MGIMRYLFVFTLSFLYGPWAQAQIDIERIKHASEDHHIQQDSAYHCGLCEKYLFDVYESTEVDEDHLHYHGVGTDDSKKAIHCSGCESHLGYYDHEHNHFLVSGDNVDKADTGIFHCAACRLPVFDEQERFSQEIIDQEEASTDNNYFYFKKPIKEDRINIDDRKKFYKVALGSPQVTCRGCNGRIGEVDLNHTNGFGVRINLGSVKKRKR